MRKNWGKDSEYLRPSIYLIAFISLAAVLIYVKVNEREDFSDDSRTRLTSKQFRRGNSKPSTEPTGDRESVGSSVIAEEAPDFIPFSTYGNEIFGSLVLTWSNASRLRRASSATNNLDAGVKEVRHYGDNCLIGVILKNVKKGELYQVEVEGGRFLNHSSVSVLIEEDAQFVTAGPVTSFNFLELQGLRQTSPFNVKFSVSRAGGKVRLKEQVWQAHQINDCPLALTRFYVSTDGTIGSYVVPWPTTFSGYVNENHPWIDVILREALDIGKCKSFTGYADDEAETMAQVFSIWSALVNRRITYSNISTTTKSEIHHFQHVRFIEETLDSRQANCIDGSVLLASLLRKIGLNVGIIIVPGHAYVAVYDKTDRARWFAIETTMMNSSLHDAIQHATFDGEYALAKISGKLGKPGRYDFTEIRISKYREYGVLPIPYTGQRSLVKIPAREVSDTKMAVSGGDFPYKVDAPSADSGLSLSQTHNDVEMRQYFNSRGVRTAQQESLEMKAYGEWAYKEAHKYDNLSPRDAAWMKRKDLARGWLAKIADLKSKLKEDPYALEKYVYWKELVAEINSARISFNSVTTPSFIASETEKISPEQKRQAELALFNCVKTLRETDPYLGRKPADITNKEFPLVLERADLVCNALAIVAFLPLEF